MKSDTDKLINLYKLIRDDYQEILSKKDLSAIYFIIATKIDASIEEERKQKIL